MAAKKKTSTKKTSKTTTKKTSKATTKKSATKKSATKKSATKKSATKKSATKKAITKSEVPVKKGLTMVRHKTDPAEVEKGHLVAFIYWAEVQEVEENDGDYKVTVQDLDRDTAFAVSGNELIGASMSADIYNEEVRANQSDVILAMMKLYNTPFTVCFDKKDGTERTIRGRLIEPDGLRGRSKVEELIDADGKPVPTEKRFKQVDHRTIKWLIANGVKYIVR